MLLETIKKKGKKPLKKVKKGPINCPNDLLYHSLSKSPFTNPLRHKGCIHEQIIGQLSKTSFWEGVINEKTV